MSLLSWGRGRLCGCTGSGGFAGIDVADDHDVHVSLFFTVARRKVSIRKVDDE